MKTTLVPFGQQSAGTSAAQRTYPAMSATPALGGLDSLASGDPAVSRAIELCRKARDADLPMLILGETGVGKDMLARAVHASGPRAGSKFTAINCAAVPASLLASELFGYLPGTFTDAAKTGYAGKLVSSNGGTVFLDEIGDMPLDLQAYLLRVLDEQRITPLGGLKPVALDVRFISATHHDLDRLVARGLFRRDLYYRLRGIQITLPALRERADLPDLLGQLFQQEAKHLSRAIVLGRDVVDVLCKYDWPGNIRELRSVLRVALCTCEEGQLGVADLPSPLIELARELGYLSA
jgi:transcriptional regulator of acetoin/glycerol metabolism